MERKGIAELQSGDFVVSKYIYAKIVFVEYKTKQ